MQPCGSCLGTLRLTLSWNALSGLKIIGVLAGDLVSVILISYVPSFAGATAFAPWQNAVKGQLSALCGPIMYHTPGWQGQ